MLSPKVSVRDQIEADLAPFVPLKQHADQQIGRQDSAKGDEKESFSPAHHLATVLCGGRWTRSRAIWKVVLPRLDRRPPCFRSVCCASDADVANVRLSAPRIAKQAGGCGATRAKEERAKTRCAWVQLPARVNARGAWMDGQAVRIMMSTAVTEAGGHLDLKKK